MKQYLTRKNIAIGVIGFLFVITLFQFFIVKYIGTPKHKIDQINSLPDNNIQNEVILQQDVTTQPSTTAITLDKITEKTKSSTIPITKTPTTTKQKEQQKPAENMNKNVPSLKKKISKNKPKLKQKDTKAVKVNKKSSTLPPVYYLFICTLDKLCERPKAWVDALVKSYNDISTKAKDITESINFVIIGGNGDIPSQFSHVKISKEGTIQTLVNDYITNSIKDDNALIVFITDLSIPVSTSITDTFYFLEDSIIVGGIVISEKSGRIVNSGWDLKLRSCKGQSTHSVAFTPHMYGKELSALLDTTNSEEEEMIVLIPSFNGVSIIKQTWKYFGGFNMDYQKDYIFDFLLRIQEHNEETSILPENIVKYYGNENYEEYIISDSEPCSLVNEKISFRNAESEISKQYYENVMNLFFTKLEVKNINLVYAIPSDLPSQHISNAINMEGKIVLKLNTTQQVSKIHMSETDRISFNRMNNLIHSDDSIPLVSIATYDPTVNCPRKQYCIGLLSTNLKQLKQEDVNKMNQQYDEIWVSEKRQAKTLKRMGVKKRKPQYVPRGVDTSAFKQDQNVKPNVPSSYLSVFSDWEKEREKIKLLVEAFATSFDHVSNVKLTIFIQDFTSSSNDKTSQEIIKELGISTEFSKPPMIKILQLDTRKVETPHFYHDYQVLVSFTENQSHLVMKAMSSGLLIVSPVDLFEFLNKDNSLLIKQAKSVESWTEIFKYIHLERNLSLIHELCKVARLDMVEYYDNIVIAKDILSKLRDIEDYLNSH